MNSQHQSDDYFSQAAIKERITQRLHRKFIVRTHLFIAILLTLVGVYAYTQTSVFVRDGLFASLLLFIWGFYGVHTIWERTKTHGEAEIDAEMHKAREYELRRYELDRDHNHDAAYRLGDDGELFDDINQTAYELKPKRKLNQ
jgi:hypothetical protein